MDGFKKFLMRGNVVDLAVGVIIGAAFTTVVTAFTDQIIQPLIGVITGGKEGEIGGTFEINGQVFNYGALISAVINFVIVAAVLYFFVVLPINKLQERRARGQEPEAEPTNEEKMVALLEQIAAKQ